jgi:hypothetical protein
MTPEQAAEIIQLLKSLDGTGWIMIIQLSLILGSIWVGVTR